MDLNNTLGSRQLEIHMYSYTKVDDLPVTNSQPIENKYNLEMLQHWDKDGDVAAIPGKSHLGIK